MRNARDARNGAVGTTAGSRSTGRNSWSLWLLLIPYVALLFPSFYARLTPRLDGIPFFVWYQMLWVILGALVIFAVYVLRGGSEGS
ncbi:MAG: DUF3311 domain-containing protein [Acidimicrobiales bacterium]